MAACIAACLECHEVCLHTAMTHCLEEGGAHVEPGHLRLMMNCAEICQTSANFMISGSQFHSLTCGVCAEICRHCAESCKAIKGMDECADCCSACSESCAAMSK